MLKETRQDLVRAETKLNFERRWKWPVRLACFGLGVGSFASIQNQALISTASEFIRSTGAGMMGAGNMALLGLLVVAVAVYAAVWMIRRAMRVPTPEQTARKLMKEFARKDGVAAYVFVGEERPEDEAASLGALTREENKMFRQRRLTQSNRTLSSSLMRLLNRTVDETHTPLH